MCQHVTPYCSCMREIRQERRKARSPAQHNPAAPDGGYCCHDAALQLSRLPTLAGGGIRFGLVRSDDQPPSPQRDGEQAGRRAGGGEAWPGPWALQMGRVHTRPSIARSMRYKSPRAVRTLDGVLLPYRPGQVSHWDRRRQACRKGEARLRWTSGRLLAERERKRLGTEAGYFVRRPLREKASPNITRGPERSHKGCAPPPHQLFVNCLKPEILHERDLPYPAATLVRWPSRANPDRKGFNVSQEPSEVNRETRRSSLTAYSAVLYRQI